MASFTYRAVDAAGSESRGIESAATLNEAIRSLRSRGLFPLEVAEQGGASGGRRGRLSTTDLSLILRGIGDQLKAGVPLDRALRGAAALLPPAKARRIEDLLLAVRTGRSLSDAMKDGEWPEFVVNSVSAGEAAGALDQVLVRLSEHYERSARFRSDISLALAYPAFILGVGVLSMAVIVVFIVPKLVTIFQGYEERLPLVTQVFLALSVFLREHWPVVLVGGSALTAGLLFLVLAPQGKEALKSLSWVTPGVARLVRGLEWGRLARTMALLIGNGVPLLAAIDLARQGATARPVREVMERLYTGIRSGEKFSVLIRNEPTVPEMIRQMVSMGEESGAYDSAFVRMADFYDREVDVSLRRIITFAEPVLIVLLAGTIGLVVVAVILGIYSIMEVTL